MELDEVVLKLTGPVKAVGETHEDVKRLKNLKTLTDLVTRLLLEIENAATDANRQEHSMREIGTHASNFLTELEAK